MQLMRLSEKVASLGKFREGFVSSSGRSSNFLLVFQLKHHFDILVSAAADFVFCID